MLMRVVAWLRSVFLRGRLERAMRAEMASHLEQATSRLTARGMARAEAEREARREFGHLDVLQEEARDARGSRWIEATAADVRFAFRQFRRTPIATVTMLLVLALGIGANTALFTVLHSMLTMPPPGIPRDAALVRIRAIDRESLSLAEVTEYARLTDLFSSVVAAGRGGQLALDIGGAEDGAIPGNALYVSDDYFDALGVRPLIGTTLSVARSGSGGSPLVAVIGHELWQSHYGASQNVLGRTLKVNDMPVTIVGVAPPRFRGADQGYYRTQIWLPADALDTIEPIPAGAPDNVYRASWSAVARLRAGVSRERAEAAVKVVAERVLAQTEATRRRPPERKPTADIAPVLAGNTTKPHNQNMLIGSAMSSALALLILLITCTNVSALLVGMAVSRRREIAVRLSLGAPRGRVVRQLVTESALLAVAAGMLGVLVIAILLRLFGTYVPDIQLTLAWPVLLFTFAFALATGLAFGLSPALHATRLSVSDVLKDAGPGVSHARGRLQRSLIVTQIALTQPLLVGLGTLILLFVGELKTRTTSPFEDRIVTIAFSNAGRATTARNQQQHRQAWTNDMQRQRNRLAALPGVVGAVHHAGYGIGLNFNQPYRIHPADRVDGAWSDRPLRTDAAVAVVPGWFAVMGIPIVAGRDFATETDRDSAAIIIGSDLAQMLWGDANPIGRRLQPEASTTADDRLRDRHNSAAPERVVIGVVDARAAGPSMTPDGARVFVALAGPYPVTSSVRLRTMGPAQALLPAIRKAAAAAVPDMPISSITTLSAETAAERRTVMLTGGAAGTGGLLALFLAAIGLYALVSLAVTQRTREIGIRSALGADRRDIIRLFFGSGLRLSVMGLLLGLPLSLFVLSMLEHYADAPRIQLPALAAAVALCVIGVASLATWIPARRAAGVSPLDTLRDAG